MSQQITADHKSTYFTINLKQETKYNLKTKREGSIIMSQNPKEWRVYPSIMSPSPITSWLKYHCHCQFSIHNLK